MNELMQALLPEIILTVVACALILLGVSAKAAARRLAPWGALLALLVVFVLQFFGAEMYDALADPWGTVRVFEFAQYIKLLAAGVGALLVLLAWPANRDATGNSALDFGADAGEFFGLMLLSITGIFLVASADDMILLFLGIELASIPTYIMVSISRPLPVAQEAGVKYFFLGAMSAALMLFGFSYLYGTTGLLNLHEIAALLRAPLRDRVALDSWQLLAMLMIIAGVSFKIAAVPLHFYAGDVYQGAATPVTAFLSFVPKISGMVALIKVLFAIGGPFWAVPEPVARLLWIVAVLTMSVGNVLGLLQFNVKRLLAYSSIAHSGYLLVGVATMVGTVDISVQQLALQGVLFYLAAYGVMNAGAFAVLMMLPSRQPRAATSAETLEDLAGQGRRHPGLGLAMAICCFSLIGLPLTVGFLGKVYLIRPALDGHFYWLAILMVANAAVSAAYYLRIIAAMFLRPDPALVITEAGQTVPPADACGPVCMKTVPLILAVVLSAGGALVLGTLLPATYLVTSRAQRAVYLDRAAPNVAAPADIHD